VLVLVGMTPHLFLFTSAYSLRYPEKRCMVCLEGWGIRLGAFLRAITGFR